LQRLFSTFANGWPGKGLLLQRVATTAALIHCGIAGLREAHQFASIALQIIAAGAVLSRPADPWIPIMLATLGAALAMLGPGAWSIDARLFGRKHIDISKRQRHFHLPLKS
jgi:putative oxidoreductase